MLAYCICGLVVVCLGIVLYAVNRRDTVEATVKFFGFSFTLKAKASSDASHE